MAKISARGAYKLAEAHIDMDNPDDRHCGGVIRRFFVLRSDGTILSSWSWPKHPDSYHRRRQAYKLWRRFKPEVDHSPAGLRAAFARLAEKKGWDQS